MKQSVAVHIMNATMHCKQQRCAAHKKDALQAKNERCKQIHVMHHCESIEEGVAVVLRVTMQPKVFGYFECSSGNLR